MFEAGDLVQINEQCVLKYFINKLAIVRMNLGYDATDHGHGKYYMLHFSDGSEHVFCESELDLISRVNKK
jgi:hypothetical protein